MTGHSTCAGPTPTFQTNTESQVHKTRTLVPLTRTWALSQHRWKPLLFHLSDIWRQNIPDRPQIAAGRVEAKLTVAKLGFSVLLSADSPHPTPSSRP